MVIGELLRMDLGSRRNHLVIAISSRFEDHRINKLKGITTPAEDRLVASQITNALLEFLKDTPRQEKGLGARSKRWWIWGLVMRGHDAPTATVLHPSSKSRRFWVMAVSIGMLLTGIIALLPAALTWKAQLPPFTAPQDTSLKKLGNPSLPDSSKDAVIPKARKVISGKFCDDSTGVQLEGVKVCAVAYDKHGRSISSPPCKTTNAYGNFEIELNITDAETIEMNVDGAAIGYDKRSIRMDPKRETSGRHLFLRKL